MAVEGINLYFKLVKVYGAEQPRMKLYMIIGWVVPIPIVAITVGAKFNVYTSSQRWDNELESIKGVSTHKWHFALYWNSIEDGDTCVV